MVFQPAVWHIANGIIAEKLVAYGVQSGLSVLAAKQIADHLSSDEFEHLLTLTMLGNETLTTNYLASLEDKYARTIALAPTEIPKLEGRPIPEQNKGLSTATPNDSNKQGAWDTGNSDRAPTGSITTTTPIADAPSQDDVAYLAKNGDKYEPNKGSVNNIGEFFNHPGFGNEAKSNSRKTNQIYQGQSVYQAKGNIGDYIVKDDKYYLDSMHRNHIEVFDKK